MMQNIVLCASSNTGNTQKGVNTNSSENISLWESFCNEVLSPVIEDIAYDYLDKNYGTNLAEAKKQKETEEAYYEVLIQEEENSNRTFGEAASDALAGCMTDCLNKYLDDNLGTNFVEKKSAREQEKTKLLEEAHEYQAQKEAKASKGGNFLINLLSLLFNKS